MLSHAIGGGRDLRRAGVDTTLSLPSGGAETQFCRGVSSFETDFGLCGRGPFSASPHWSYDGVRAPTRRWLEMGWTAPGAVGGLVLDEPLDLSDRRLELRTIVDDRRGDVELAVRVTDADGASADLTPVGGQRLPVVQPGPGITKLWAQALVVDPSGAADVDLTRIVRVELVGRLGERAPLGR